MSDQIEPPLPEGVRSSDVLESLATTFEAEASRARAEEKRWERDEEWGTANVYHGEMLAYERAATAVRDKIQRLSNDELCGGGPTGGSNAD